MSRVFQNARLVRNVIEILIHAVRALRRGVHRDVVLGTVVHQIGSTLELLQKLTHPPGCDHFHIGAKGVEGQLKPDLVVALTGRSVGQQRGSHAIGHVEHGARDARASYGRAEQISSLVKRVRLDRGEDEIGHKLPLEIFHVDFGRTDGQRLFLHRLEVFLLPDVADKSNHFVAALHQPLQDARGI